MTIRSDSLRQNPAYRPGFSLPTFAALALAAGLSACARRVPEQVLAGAPVAPAPVIARPARWTPRPTGVAIDYTMDVAGALAIDDGGGTQRDSTTLRLVASVRRASGTGFSGVIRSASVRSPGSGTMVPLARMPVPAPYTAPAAVGVQPTPTSRLASANPCDGNLGVALQALRELLVTTPDTVVIGSSWTDSSAYRTCRDGIPLEVVAHRRFTVDGAATDSAGRTTLVVTRRSRMSYSGWDARGDDTTWVSGRGIAELRYRLDGATGAVGGAEGSGSLDVEIRTGTTRQRATQTTAIRIAHAVP
jgi:hypothetical protein